MSERHVSLHFLFSVCTIITAVSSILLIFKTDLKAEKNSSFFFLFFFLGGLAVY